MRKIAIVAIFLLSCHYSIKKENRLKSQIECPPCPTMVCAPDEIMICKKREVSEVSVIKVDPNKIRSFEFPDDSFKKAMELTISYLKNLNNGIEYRFAGRKINKETLLKTALKLKEIYETSLSSDDFTKSIKENFDLYELVKGTEPVLFSSYYEPVFEASFKKDDVYKYPIYRKPDDMIDINLEDFDPDRYKGQKLTGKLLGTKLIPYYSRQEIDFDGVLAGKGYELAYLKDITDVLDLHTQGSGILKMREGGYKRAKFAATNSLKFKGWMSVLIEKGYIERKGGVGEDKSFYERAKKFINENQNLWRDVIGQNKRYTFFYLDDIKSLDEGPTGTYGLNLVAHRSVAVDNSIIPLGLVCFIDLELPEISDDLEIKGFKQTQRFVFSHDTGGAIKGARVDYFAGTGDKAKKFAYSVWKKGNFYILVIKEGR